MKIQISIIAGIVLCLASVRAADSNEDGTDPATKKEKLTADQGTGTQSATQGRGQFTISTGAIHSGKNKKNKTSVAVGDVNKADREAAAHTNNQGKLIVGVDDGKNTSHKGTDAQGKLLVGTDGGVWRSGKNKKTKVTTGDTNKTGSEDAAQGLNGHNTGALRNTSGSNAPAQGSGVQSSGALENLSGSNTWAGQTGAPAAKKSKKVKQQGEPKKADKDMTLKGKKILEN